MNHKWLPSEDGFVCEQCQWRSKRRHTHPAACPGVTRYTWETQQQTNLQSISLLRKMGLRPGGPPVGARWSEMLGQWVWLYDPGTAVARPRATPAQLAALAKAQETLRTCKGCGTVYPNRRDLDEHRYCWTCIQQAEERSRKQAQDKMIRWARKIIANPQRYVILDTETTTLHGLPIDIAVIDSGGSVLFNSLINPKGAIDPEATAVHGLTDADVATAPRFPDIYPQLVEILAGRTIVAYNDDYDYGVLWYACETYKLPPFENRWRCAMRAYAQYVGQVRRDGDYQWWPLDGGHRALGDCQATLHLIRGMAETHTAEEEASSVLLPDEWQALQLAYQAGEAGIRRQRGADGYISYAGLRVQVWTYLEEREFIHGEWRGDGDEDRWLFLTAAGRQFYEQHSATQDATARPPEPAAQPDAD